MKCFEEVACDDVNYFRNRLSGDEISVTRNS
jgi:hypothetical protein